MATLYVDSTATGLADGTSWTDAWTDLQTAWAAWTSGDEIWVEKDHSQTQATEEKFVADVMGEGDPCIIYSVDSADDSYSPATTAQIAVTGAAIDLWFDDSVILYGLFLQVEDGDFKWGTQTVQIAHDCNFKWTTTTADRDFQSVYGFVAKGCTWDNPSVAGGSRIFITGGGVLIDCVGKGRSHNSGYLWGGNLGDGRGGNQAIGCDFDGITNSINVQYFDSSWIFTGCFAQDTFRSPATSYYNQAHIFASGDDGSVAKNYIAEVKNMMGDVIQDTAIYRDDGWQDEDGSTRLSHKMTPASNMRGPHTPFFGPELRAYIGSTRSKTLTVYGVHDFATAPTEDNCWIEVLYLGTASNVLYSLAGGRTVFSTTGVASDTKAWTGAAGKTKLKIAETFTVNKVGTYILRVHLAYYESAKALWYCPLVEVS